MLVALEGPDRSGKTSVWRALVQDSELFAVRFIPNIEADSVLLHAGDAVQLASEQRVDAWLRAFHESRTVYLMDRCPPVSNLVYAVVHKRDVDSRWRTFSWWSQHLFVVHFDTDEAVLKVRGATDVEASAAAVYRSVLGNVPHVRVNAAAQLSDVVREVRTTLKSLMRRNCA